MGEKVAGRTAGRISTFADVSCADGRMSGCNVACVSAGHKVGLPPVAGAGSDFGLGRGGAGSFGGAGLGVSRSTQMMSWY